MKKHNTMTKILLLCILFSFLISGCKQKEGLKAYSVGGSSDGSTQASSIAEYDLWSSENMWYHKDSSAAKTVTVEFEGKFYTGEYNHSDVKMMANYRSDEYLFENGYFGINATTGKLVYIHFDNFGKRDKKITIEQGAEIAKEIAIKQIDISNYELIEKETNISYTYTFMRKLSNIYTCEKLFVSINFDGEITAYSHFMCDTFPNSDQTEKYEERVKELTSDTAMELLSKAVEEKYPAVIEYSAPWSITDKWLVLDEDNNICILYKVEIESTYDRNIVDEYGGIKETSHGALDFILIK